MVQLPSPFSAIPRVELLFPRPSDIEELKRLTSELADSGATFWIKRDDCSSGLAFGGNKARKLEYVLADALAKGADTLVTTGGVQSNHMRQTAAAAAKLGMKVVLHPRKAVDTEAEQYHTLGNVQLNEILGAETFPVGTTEESALDEVRSRGNRPYAIPSGASAHPLGGLGYARWAFELLEQEAQLGVTFDTIVLALGSGSTLGGMLAGFKLAKKEGLLPRPKRLLGFSITGKPNDEVKQLVLSIAQTAGEKLGLGRNEFQLDDFEVDDSFLGAAYGVLDQRTKDGVKTVARLEGILTDPVYTGKAITGMIHTAKSGGFTGSNVLFCHTGGQVALSAYPDLR